MQFLRASPGQRTKGAETTPSVGLFSTCPTGYMTRSCYCICCVPHCSPPPFKLCLHLPQIRRSLTTLNHLASPGVFGEHEASLRHSDQECRMLPARVQAKFGMMFLVCYLVVVLKILTARCQGRTNLGVQHGSSADFSTVLGLRMFDAWSGRRRS